MNDTIIDASFVKQDFVRKKLPAKEYDNCTFTNCDFTESNLSVVTFIECTFTDCNFSKVIIKETSFIDKCVFEHCKLLGVDFSSGNDFLFEVQFKNCNLTYASFYGFTMKGTYFKDCKLQEADFTEANIIGSVFDECDLNNAIFENTIAEKADFSKAFNYTIDPTLNKLKKAKFSKDRLEGLLRKYDLIVK